MYYKSVKGLRMFNVNFMLAQAIQRDHLRIAGRDRLSRLILDAARKKLPVKRVKKENR